MKEKDVVYILFLALPIIVAMLILANAASFKNHRPKVRNVTLGLGGFLFALSLLFPLGETYYRFIDDKPDSFGLTAISKRWFEKHFRMNNLGFRDNQNYEKIPAPGTTLRLTFVGDSFTAGHGVNDPENRFANLIRQNHPDWEVHIIAAPGQDTGAEFNTVAKLVRNGYKLDYVVLIYVLNDISDIVPEWAGILKRIYTRNKEEGFWIKNSFLINTLYYHFKASRDPDMKSYYHFVKDAYESPLFLKQKERLKNFQLAFQESGAKMAVVTFPFLHALGNQYEYQKVHDDLNAFWKERGIPHLDLLKTYQPYPPSRLVVSPWDAHPNRFAHQLAAQALEPFLESWIKETKTH